MYIIDLSNGFSSTILVESLLTIDRNNVDMVTAALSESPLYKTEYRNIGEGILNVFKTKQRDGSVVDSCAGKKIKYDELILFSGKYNTAFKETISKDPGFETDVFDCIINLILSILIESLRNQYSIRTTIPRIGINSPRKTFDVLRGEKTIIDSRGKNVTQLNASLLAYYFKPFVETFFSPIHRITEIFDSFDKTAMIRFFEVNDSYNNAYNDEEDIITVLETNIDDSTSEIIGNALQRLLKKGALDYTIAPVTMKKGRPGFTIQVICDHEKADDLAREMLISTSSFGVRKYYTERVKLRRKIMPYQTRFGQIRIKEGFLGDKLIKITPEFDDVVRISEEKNISPYILYNVIIGEINQKIV